MSKQEARAQRISEWLEHLRRWDVAGGSLASYAKKHGLAQWALYHWRGVLIREGRWQPRRETAKAESGAHHTVVPLHFARVRVAEAPVAPYIVRLQFGNGRRAEIEMAHIDPLVDLISALERHP